MPLLFKRRYGVASALDGVIAYHALYHPRRGAACSRQEFRKISRKIYLCHSFRDRRAVRVYPPVHPIRRGKRNGYRLHCYKRDRRGCALCVPCVCPIPQKRRSRRFTIGMRDYYSGIDHFFAVLAAYLPRADQSAVLAVRCNCDHHFYQRVYRVCRYEKV